MLRHEQLIRSNKGDCFRTALACLLDVPNVEDVPHFFDGEIEATTEEKEAKWSAVRTWLYEEKGLHLLTIPYTAPNLDDLLKSIGYQNPGLYYLLCGSSDIDNHVVVCYEDKIIHDVAGGYPEGQHCLVGPCTDGYYWVKFLLPAFHGKLS